MSQPFFSIVIPTYNREKLIGKTLSTVLQQTCQDFEIIIVDNCSTDDTVKVLQPFLTDPRIRLQVQEQNYERSRSRNKGMELARGKFLTFLDSDDLLYPHALGLAMNYVKEHADTTFFHEYYESRDTEGRLVYKYPFPARGVNLRRRLFLANFLSCIVVYISRDVYSKYLFDENKASLGSEDWDFWLRVNADHDLGVIPVVSAAIVQHDERTVAGNRASAIMERKEYYLNKYKNDKILFNKISSYLPVFESGFYLYTSTVAWQSRNFGKGYGYLAKALGKSPSILGSSVFWKIALSPLKQIFK